MSTIMRQVARAGASLAEALGLRRASLVAPEVVEAGPPRVRAGSLPNLYRGYAGPRQGWIPAEGFPVRARVNPQDAKAVQEAAKRHQADDHNDIPFNPPRFRPRDSISTSTDKDIAGRYAADNPFVQFMYGEGRVWVIAPAHVDAPMVEGRSDKEVTIVGPVPPRAILGYHKLNPDGTAGEFVSTKPDGSS